MKITKSQLKSLIKNVIEESSFRQSDHSLDPFVRSYYTSALWSSSDDEGNPIDDNYTIEDFDSQSYKEMEAEALEFKAEAEELYKKGGWSDDQAGHDFWLTRNGHGAGFWDRTESEGYDEEIGKQLTDIAKKYGEKNIFVQDDKLFIEESTERKQTVIANKIINGKKLTDDEKKWASKNDQLVWDEIERLGEFEYEDQAEKSIRRGKKIKEEGVGYELYAKGVDRVSTQCKTISDIASVLAKWVRDGNVSQTRLNKKVKELKQWVDVLNKEMEGIVSDISNLEGYKKETIEETVTSKLGNLTTELSADEWNKIKTYYLDDLIGYTISENNEIVSEYDEFICSFDGKTLTYNPDFAEDIFIVLDTDTEIYLKESYESDLYDSYDNAIEMLDRTPISNLDYDILSEYGWKYDNVSKNYTKDFGRRTAVIYPGEKNSRAYYWQGVNNILSNIIDYGDTEKFVSEIEDTINNEIDKYYEEANMEYFGSWSKSDIDDSQYPSINSRDIDWEGFGRALSDSNFYSYIERRLNELLDLDVRGMSPNDIIDILIDKVRDYEIEPYYINYLCDTIELFPGALAAYEPETIEEELEELDYLTRSQKNYIVSDFTDRLTDLYKAGKRFNELRAQGKSVNNMTYMREVKSIADDVLGPTILLAGDMINKFAFAVPYSYSVVLLDLNDNVNMPVQIFESDEFDANNFGMQNYKG